MAAHFPPTELAQALDRASAARPLAQRLRRGPAEPEGVRASVPGASFSGLTTGLGPLARQAIAEARRARAAASSSAPVPPSATASPQSTPSIAVRDLPDALAGFSFAQLYAHALDGLRRARLTLEHAEDLASGRHEARDLRRDPDTFAATPLCFAEFVATARVKLAEAEALCAVLTLCIGREAALARVLAGEGA